MSQIERPSLSLRREDVQAFWREHGALNIVQAMEAREPWVVDRAENAAVEQLVERVAVGFDAASTDLLAAAICSRAVEVVDLLGYIRTGRALRLFKWLLEQDVESGVAIVDTASNNDRVFGTLLVERLRVLAGQRVLSEVFSPSRIALLLDLLDELGVHPPDEQTQEIN